LARRLLILSDVLLEFNLIGANGAGSFPRHVRAKIHPDSATHTAAEPAVRIAGRILDLKEDHALEIRAAEERFGQQVLAVVDGWGYKFKSLELGGCFELEKNWI
jgi:hypothetical protein